MVRTLLSVTLLVLTVATIVGVAAAQPEGPDLARAAEMYRSAEQAMEQARYDDAARDYGAAYEISKDPVLFFKIGSALDKAGKCQVALTYYRRYVREGKPTPEFQRLTMERITACEISVGNSAPSSAASSSDPATVSAAPTAPAAETSAASAPDLAATSAQPVDPAAATGAATAPPIPEDSIAPPSTRRSAAWIAVGAGIALLTTGAVFALSVESTEDDIADLYLTRPGGQPTTFDNATQKRYQDLVDRGDRYQLLSWASFGVAAGAAGAATYLFLSSRTRPPERRRLTVRPSLRSGTISVGADWSW
jgi:hypothetical protein